MAELKFHSSITEISSDQWDRLWLNTKNTGKHKLDSFSLQNNILPYPFTQHAFLKILEDCQCTKTESGWEVNHATLWQDNLLVAAMPLYKKTHSYGEYVFDWSWADAYHRNNLPYYPKWVCAIPFTPSTGPRIAVLGQDTVNAAELAEELQTKLIEQIEEQNCSSLHCLFPNRQSQTRINKRKLDIRYGTQFHWFNQGYQSFDGFLQQFTSRKRKNIIKERRKVEDTKLSLQMRSAREIDHEEWQRFYELYQITYLKRSGHTGYLNLNFFLSIAKQLPEQVLLASAHDGQQMIAAALYFRDSTTLYGRYWGALEDYDSLHFECCYYQGIEYAISQQLERFDPGAQGEHKIQRGFTPVNTCSFHYIHQPQFSAAIKQFLIEEKTHIGHYTEQCRLRLPFKEDVLSTPNNHLLVDTYALSI